MTRAVFTARAASAIALWLVAVATTTVCVAMILRNVLVKRMLVCYVCLERG
jgi:hypothetical protein